MVVCAYSDKLVLDEWLHTEITHRCVFRKDPNVGNAVYDGPNNIPTQLLFQLDMYVRVLAHECREALRKELCQCRHVCPQPYMAASASGVVSDFTAELLKPLKQAQRVLHRKVPRRSQAHAS